MRISDWSSDVCASDLPCLATALHAEGNDGATAPGHQLPAERVVGMVGQVRVQHPGDGVLALQDVEHLQGVGHVALHAQRQRLDALQDEIGRASCRERVCKYV